MSDGFGCTCAAYSESECCCGVDWTPKEIYELRQQLAEAQADAIEQARIVGMGGEREIGLRQQLADRDEQISDLTISSDTYFAERNSARDVWRRA